MIYCFADCELHERLYQLHRNGVPVPLEPKVFDVLVYLLQHRDRVVSKDELLDKLWPGQVVGENALTRCIRAARLAVGDDRTKQSVIETQHGRGYRFIGEVVSKEEEDRHRANGENGLVFSIQGLAANGHRLESSVQSPESEGQKSLEIDQTLDARPKTLDVSVPARPRSSTKFVLLAIGMVLLGVVFAAIRYWSTSSSSLQILTSPPQALPLPDKPSIIVLPFVNLSGDPSQEYFSDGVTEELTSTLSRVSSLFVIARTSAFTYKGKAVKVQEISREMGVRYLLEGSVQKADGHVRISVQLVDAVTGGHVWSSHYDRELRDIFALQDDIGRKVATALKVNLTSDEQERFRRFPTTNLEAYDYLLRGWESYWQETKEANTQARQLFEHAIALDPQYAAAYAGLSSTYLKDWMWQWSQDRQTLERAFDTAQKSLTLDDTLPLAYMVVASVYQKKNQHEEAIAAAQRAIALNPNNATAYMALADQMGMAGRPEEGIALAKTAMRLNPHYPSWYLLQLGSNYHQAWRNEEAIATLKRFLLYYPNSLNAHIMLTCSYSDAGREKEARAEATEVVRLSPNFKTEVWRQNQFWKDSKEMERHLNNLRKAGLK